MSNAPEGPGWWQASDGQWYDPSLAPPGYRPPEPSGPQPVPELEQAADGSWYDPRRAPNPGIAKAGDPSDPSGGRLGRWWLWTSTAAALLLLVALVAVAVSGDRPAKRASSAVTPATRPADPDPAPTTTGPPSSTTTDPAPSSTTTAPASPAASPPSTTGSSGPDANSPPTPATDPGPSCAPLSSTGNCYQPGEFCPASDHGASGTTADGGRITCVDNNGWRWEPS